MTVSEKARKVKQHWRAVKSNINEAHGNIINSKVSSDKQICNNCKHESFYKFFRCPTCGQNQL